MIIRGTSTPALRTLASVSLAVFSILGRMEALMAAVRVRRVRPYSLVISLAAVASNFICLAMLQTPVSFSISSTP